MPHHKGLRKAEEVNFNSKFSFFASLSAAEAQVFGVKFIGHLWPAMNGLVCLSLLLEGGVTVSNNFTKRRQNGLKLAQETK